MRNLKLMTICIFMFVFTGSILGQNPDINATIIKAVNDQSRDVKESKRDKNRKPHEILHILGVKPGMSVADLSSGLGYYTDILSRIVGDDGNVIAHNTDFLVNRYADTFKEGGTWDKRFSSSSWRRNVTKYISPLAEFKLDKPVDLAIMVLFYHDTIWQKTDREKMNKAIFNSIKSGGHYLIVDHSAEKGSGGRDAREYHRVDKELVITELTAAGFKLVEDSKLLSHPEDTHDYNVFRDVSTNRDMTDRFVIKFIRP